MSNNLDDYEVMFKTDTEVISTWELNISYNPNTQTNSNDKIILAWDFNDILSLNVNVINEDCWIQYPNAIIFKLKRDNTHRIFCNYIKNI